MTEPQAEKLISSLESGHAGIEAFLGLSADDRATIMSMLEQRAGARERRQILEQSEAEGTTERISALPNSEKCPGTNSKSSLQSFYQE
jgi:hypothetical protein